MKLRFAAVWGLGAACMSVIPGGAQDVSVMEPAWIDAENPMGDTPPKFKKAPDYTYPEELKRTDDFAYALLISTVDEKGGHILSGRPRFSNPYVDIVLKEKAVLVPAIRNGKPVSSGIWYAVIFNPKTAKKKGEDATLRLLAVAPAIASKSELPADAKVPLVVWCKASVDAKGAVEQFAFEDARFESLRGTVGGSLARWHFAPARKDGQPVAAEARIPVIIDTAFRVPMPGIPPKAVKRVQPTYPRAMLASRLRGEVLVALVVDETGSVQNATVVRSSNPGFNEAALEAIAEWKFEPARQGGAPVKARLQQSFQFEFRGSRGGRDLYVVENASAKQKAKLPPEYQFDVPPRPDGVIVPVYPHSLMADNVKGKAAVLMLINPDGRVSDVKVTEATRPEFGLALAAAVESFHFVPAIKDGRPTKSVLRMERTFTAGMFSDLFSSEDRDLISLEKNHPERVYAETALGAPLKVTVKHSAVSPVLAADPTTGGSAMIEVLVDDTGTPRLPRIVEATDPAYAYAAMQALVQWRYEPPSAGGKQVVARTQVLFTFGAKNPQQ